MENEMYSSPPSFPSDNEQPVSWPSPSRAPHSSFVGGQPSSFAHGEQRTSFVDVHPSSFSNVERRPNSSFVGEPPSISFAERERRAKTSFVGRQSSGDRRPTQYSDLIRPTSDPVRPTSDARIVSAPSDGGESNKRVLKSDGDNNNNNNNNKRKHIKVEPLFTMKRLDKYTHTPNEVLLAQLAKTHYEAGNLDDIIHSALRMEMNSESLNIFTKIAYECLDDQRPQRPNIDKILENLEEALKIQEMSMASGKVNETSDRWKGTPSEHLQIPLEDIQKATQRASYKCLGEGSFGKVYSAELEISIEEKATGERSKKQTFVALKRITDPQRGKKGFDAEINLLTGCRHPNVVSLLGFCDEGPNMILVYEIASNGSLDKYMVKPDSLTWVQRIKIAIGIARGLHYLHTREGDAETIVHRDIKSGNILLSKNLEAKIADFGLSRFQPANSIRTEHIAGTNFYLCPEYDMGGRLTTAVDIYSFGVVLFEILSGKLANDPTYLAEDFRGIAQVARIRFEEKKLNKLVDSKIMEEVDELTSTIHKGPNQDSLRTFLDIAYECLAEAQNNRPTAKHILDELEKALLYQQKNNDNLQMSFEEISLATQEFSKDNLIGSGGFGNVYKGKRTRGGKTTTIVAKRFHGKKGQGEENFLMELEILFDYKHENIIGLEGYCNENGEKIIVYEHASRKSLDRRLSNPITWTKRLEICIDIARGLSFLHEDAPTNEAVIHRDIKSANILLTDDWKAKISDFGLSVITARNQQVNSLVVGTESYVDPQAEEAGFFTEKSDIYSLGVVLFEILYGQLLVPTRDYEKEAAARILEQIHDEEKLESIVFKDIKEQIAPKSLSIFRLIVSQCLVHDRKKRPTAKTVLQQLEKSLEFQEDHEKWVRELPEDYEEILKLSTYSRTYSTLMKKEIYNLLCKGILLEDDKLLFTLGSKGERTEMISARSFSYRNHGPHDKWCVVSESRFKKVAEMLDISNLMIKIKTRTQFLSLDTIYGVYLVFKFCDSRNVSSNPMYVDLKYRKGSKTLHAYFAKRRDDEWMMIELYRFSNQKKNVVLKFLLESLSPSYARTDQDAIYVEGIEFRAINDTSLDARHHVIEESNETQQVIIQSNLNVDQELPFPTESEEIFKRSKYCDHEEKLFSLTEMNGKKHIMVSPKAALLNFSNSKLFNLKPSAESRFKEVFELLPQQIFRINSMIKSQMLSHDTEYTCYLVFKLSEKCHGLHGPVEVRDLLKKNKVVEIVYFRSPSPWNIHDITQVPKRRKDGLMEVNIWKVNLESQNENDCVLVNLKLTNYEGSMSGLIIYGLEFRPM